MYYSPHGGGAVIQVFDGVWIEVEGKTGRYVRMCSLHGRERARLEPARGPGETRDRAILAELITVACAARDAREFWKIIRESGEEWWADPNPAWGGYCWTASWLRRTLGTDRAEIELALERIAGCDAPPSGYEVDDWGRPLASFYAAGLGIAAAELFCFPALLALTDTCAEYDVLIHAFTMKSTELYCRLVEKHHSTGLSPWKAAAECARIFLEILRGRHRYVL